MNICSLRLKVNGKREKDYHFSNIEKAAIFESTFKNLKSVKFELMYEELPQSGSLLRELSLEPKGYAEKERSKIFAVCSKNKKKNPED